MAGNSPRTAGVRSRCRCASVFCRISDGMMRRTADSGQERLKSAERTREGTSWSGGAGVERRIYSRKVLAEPLALALNVHYSPIIKPDKLTLEVPGEHG